MVWLGSHLSFSGGYESMGQTALRMGEDTFAFFTRNPRGGKAKAPDGEDAAALETLMAEAHFGPLVAHAPYTMNLCSDKPSVRTFAEDMMADDLRRMAMLPGHFYNFHPGSHVGQGLENGITMITEALNRVISPTMTTTVLLETMAGKGSEVGGSFEELREILDRLDHPEKVGICFDTCHVWDGGYDIVGDPDGVLTAFDTIIGLDKLKAVHFNDSKNPCGSRKDRHEKLGQGCIGEEAMKRLLRHPALDGRPFILETPNDEAGYCEEIAVMRQWLAE